jgi:hypothetical protein
VLKICVKNILLPRRSTRKLPKFPYASFFQHFSLQALSPEKFMMPPSLPLEDDEHTTKADRNGASVLNLLLSGEANIITFESDS